MSFFNALAEAIDGAHPKQLDELTSKVWKALGAGELSEAEAVALDERCRIRQPPRAVKGLYVPDAVKKNFINRSRSQVSPDRRASLLRRREHAATGPLPPKLAAGYTTGELAFLRIIADEWLAHGACDRSLNELAARAGICHALAKRTLRLAELDGLVKVLRRPRSGRKHLTNIVTVIRAEWLDWLNKGRRRAYAIGACNRAKPDFKLPRGVKNNPPRSSSLNENFFDQGKQGNRTGASRAGS